MKILTKLGSPLLALLALAGGASSQKWQPLKHQPSFQVGTIALLTDGTVLLHDEFDNNPGGDWYKLTPDKSGSYLNGTIKQVASLPSGYGPVYFGSVVLPDGRYIIEGGEYNAGSPVWTNLGAIYDPVKNKWTSVNPPSGWTTIGDAQSVILPKGTYMQANCCTKESALFNPASLTWTSTGAGKFDVNDEEGWTLLPDGNVLTVDAYVFQYNATGKHSELYNTATGKWSSAGNTPVQLWDSCGGATNASYEVGPAVLRPDGTVFATGAHTCGTGHTAVYDTKTGKWTKGPDFPTNLDAADSPAALETNGNVVVMVSPGYGSPGSVFLEWDGAKLTKIPGPPNASGDGSFYGHFLELPTGQLLFSDFSNDVEVFTPKGTYNKAWQPKITSVPAMITRGKSYLVKGTQFSGLSQGAAYGDDFQDATNYALVRITNNSTKHVFYARTTNPSTYAVQTGTLSESTHFTVASATETGASTLVVVTNGIPSAPKAVTVQ
jgi:hypothetical protein